MLGGVNSEGARRIEQAAFRPISWSKQDTAPTVQQIKVHNEVGVELGLWKAPTKARPSIYHRLTHRKSVKAMPIPVGEEKPAAVEVKAPPEKPVAKKRKWCGYHWCKG